MKSFIICLVLLISTSSLSVGQNETDSLKPTNECNIYTPNSVEYLESIILSARDSSVIIRKDWMNIEINLYEIRKIVFAERNIPGGIAVGGGIGFVMGFLLGASLAGIEVGGSHDAGASERISNGLLGGLILAVPGALIGGFLGKSEKVYNLTSVPDNQKLKRIREIIKENANK